MTNDLKKHFPMIRERREVLSEIRRKEHLLELFSQWTVEQQEQFLDCCTGVKGIKLLYDSFFKEIFNPDTTPERLEKVLSLILGFKVKILKVLPNDSARIASESSLLIMDIVIELEDGSIANVEAQKIGYAFPGQRSACYSADLLLRQYKRIKGEKGKHFNYKDIKKVYTIVFLEKSSAQFHAFKRKQVYIHKSKQISDTGIQIDLLQEFVFIALDIYKMKLDNNGVTIENELEAWLTFLSVDEPEIIIKLITDYPEFKALYEEVYDRCLNMERMMGMFSKELLELDKNTVQYMIDEMQDTIDTLKDSVEEKNNLLIEKESLLNEQKREIEALKKALEGKL
ncbi:MAG: PD-(D/E)XK nuclease family transposase [Ruminococcus sp.]|nr:PD-(D/E)XK nuclease family transposase [Ruminococcus sp.]